jgi:uncharacterized protein YbcI
LPDSDDNGEVRGTLTHAFLLEALHLSALSRRARKVAPVSTDEQLPTDVEGRSTALMEISNVMVRLYKEQVGRGPTKARSTWCTPDVIAVFLEDTLTPVERTMVQMGEHQRLRDMRMMFQYATVRKFCEPVEQITGRKVRAFLSGIDTEVDGLSMETFIFHPEGYDGPSRIERAEAKA